MNTRAMGCAAVGVAMAMLIGAARWEGDPVTWGEAVGGVQMGLAALPEKADVTTPVNVTVTFRNVGSVEVEMIRTNVLRFCKFELTFEGKPVERTRYGEQQLGAADVGMRSWNPLEGGEAVTFPLELSRSFDMSMEGNYVLKVTSRVADGEARSAKMTIKVADDPATTRPA